MSHSTSSDSSQSPKVTPEPKHECCGGKAAASAAADTKHSSHDCCDHAEASHAESQPCQPGSSHEAKNRSSHRPNAC